MANILPIATQAISAYQTISSLARTFNDDQDNAQSLALAQLSQQQKLSEAQSAQDAALQRVEIQANAEEDARVRRAALKRAVARQRAQFGSSGVDMSDGSSEAVLLGLFQESDDEQAARNRLDNLRFQALDQNLLQQSSSNVLSLTQAQERNKLDDFSNSLDKADALVDLFD